MKLTTNFGLKLNLLWVFETIAVNVIALLKCMA